MPYEDHLGLGSVMSVSRPFYDKFTTEKPHRHFTRVAGIAGVDILYSDVSKLLDGERVSGAASDLETILLKNSTSGVAF